MPQEVMQIVKQRMQETAKDKTQHLNASDMYLDDLKRNFASTESRNAVKNGNVPIVSKLAKGCDKLRIITDDDSDEDYDADNFDLRKSFGKPGGKLSLQEELGALKSELQGFEP